MPPLPNPQELVVRAAQYQLSYNDRLIYSYNLYYISYDIRAALTTSLIPVPQPGLIPIKLGLEGDLLTLGKV